MTDLQSRILSVLASARALDWVELRAHCNVHRNDFGNLRDALDSLVTSGQVVDVTPKGACAHYSRPDVGEVKP